MMKAARLMVVIALVAIVGMVAGALLAGRLQRGGAALAHLVSHDEEHPHDHAPAGDAGYYTCGMHPWVILPEPGLCPICHMDLTPLDPAKLAGEIAIDPVVVQNIGVRTAPVVEGPLVSEVRTVGTIGYDETALRVINTKVAGWVEDLRVDAEGVRVERGMPLFTLYSPELYAAQEQYLVAYRHRDTTPGLLDAARMRLRYFDISEEQIAQLEASGQPTRTLTIHSPYAGTVVEKLVREGARVEAGAPAYRVADLSTVWVNVTLYEHQMAWIEVGQPATMSLPSLPGKMFEGTVAYVYPYLNEAARQLRVRLAFANEDGVLKPGMFATVRLSSEISPSALLAPRDAVMRTGTRAVAFVSLGDGRFEPREVRTGWETSGGQIEVLDGLKPGERVVTSGQFLLDSESQLRSAMAQMVSGTSANDAPGGEAAAAPRPDARPTPPQPMADGYPLSTCVVTGLPLGAMGNPVVIEHAGVTVKFCCGACPPKFHRDPGPFLEKLDAAAEALQ